MGIISFSAAGFLDSFQNLVERLTASAPHKPSLLCPASTARPVPTWTANCASHHGTQPARSARPSCSTPLPATPRRPVRVLRVVDTRLSVASAGRMRISGRMADVCAELERMAALESTPCNGALLQ